MAPRSDGDRATRTFASTSSVRVSAGGCGRRRRRSPRTRPARSRPDAPLRCRQRTRTCAGDSTQDSARNRWRAKLIACRSQSPPLRSPVLGVEQRKQRKAADMAVADVPRAGPPDVVRRDWLRLVEIAGPALGLAGVRCQWFCQARRVLRPWRNCALGDQCEEPPTGSIAMLTPKTTSAPRALEALPTPSATKVWAAGVAVTEIETPTGRTRSGFERQQTRDARGEGNKQGELLTVESRSRNLLTQ